MASMKLDLPEKNHGKCSDQSNKPRPWSLPSYTSPSDKRILTGTVGTDNGREVLKGPDHVTAPVGLEVVHFDAFQHGWHGERSMGHDGLRARNKSGTPIRTRI